jgi:hypothetical protein
MASLLEQPYGCRTLCFQLTDAAASAAFSEVARERLTSKAMERPW